MSKDSNIRSSIVHNLCLLNQHKWNTIKLLLPRLIINAPYGLNFWLFRQSLKKLAVVERLFWHLGKRCSGRCFCREVRTRVNRELKHQAFLTTRTWGDRVETKSKTAFLAPIFVLSTWLPATDAAAKFTKCKRQCKHWFSRGNLRIRLSFSLHGVF